MTLQFWVWGNKKEREVMILVIRPHEASLAVCKNFAVF